MQHWTKWVIVGEDEEAQYPKVGCRLINQPRLFEDGDAMKCATLEDKIGNVRFNRRLGGSTRGRLLVLMA